MTGKLFVVPTPVGNLEDMSPRAVHVLKTVDDVYAEDTRTTSVLFRHFGLTTPLHSFHKYNEHVKVDAIVRQISEGKNIALVSDAGTPGISDPGFLITRRCRNQGIEIETLPGPTAFVPALINSGLPCDRFFFEGFLPIKKGRKTRIAELAKLPVTFIIYESPIRIVKTLSELADVCGPQRAASVSREISKIHNTTVNASLSELKDYFAMNIPKGEIVLVVEGFCEKKEINRVHKNKFTDISENNKS